MPDNVRVNLEVNTDGLNRILRNLPGNKRDKVRAVAFALEAQIKVEIQHQGLIDTGSHVNSVYAKERSGGPGLPSVANTKAERVDMPVPDNDFTMHVGPTLAYSPLLEFGTESPKRDARPYMVPAVAAVGRGLAKHFEGLIDD